MAKRATLIQLIHIGAAKLFSDDEARRAWQVARTGQASCSDMSNNQLEALVDDLRANGALAKRAPRRAGRVPFNRSPYMAKIEAQLADMGLSWQYAEAIAWRITGGKGLKPQSQPGVQRLEWVRQEKHFKGIIAALAVEHEKRGLLGTIERLAPQLTTDDIERLLPLELHGGKWQRDLPALRGLVEYLAARAAQAEEETCL